MNDFVSRYSAILLLEAASVLNEVSCQQFFDSLQLLAVA